LPEDNSGVDVPKVFKIFEEALKDLAWKVKPEVWLGQFSFTKFLLWKDLADRQEDLERNRIVKHLVNASSDTPYPNSLDDVLPHDLDRKFQPQEIFCPLSTDSSQLAAIMLAADGHDFVLEGPPGTGKSQTITNIIAHCLAIGKSVLFVAEKRAALDVVYRRLKQQNLEPFCLELHSNKSGKREVLEQFNNSLNYACHQPPIQWVACADELQRSRDTLNQYVRILHQTCSCGLSAYACMNYLLSRPDRPSVRLANWPVLYMKPEMLTSVRELARKLQMYAEALGVVSGHLLTGIGYATWSSLWETQVFEQVQALRITVNETVTATEDFCQWLKISKAIHSQRELYDYYWLAESLSQPLPVGVDFATASWATLEADLNRWIALSNVRLEMRSSLASFDEQRLTALNLTAMYEQWQLAQSKWFLSKWLDCRAVRYLLKTANISGQMPPSLSVTEILRNGIRLQEINREFAADQQRAESCLGVMWQGGEPDVATLTEALEWGIKLHTRMLACANGDIVWLEQLRILLATLFKEGAIVYDANTIIGKRIWRYMNSLSVVVNDFNVLAENLQLQRESIDADNDHLGAIAKLLERLLTGWSQIRYWCMWQDTRQQAIGSGLDTLVEAVEKGTINHKNLVEVFECSFRRELLNAIISSNMILRNFFSQAHLNEISRFCSVDEQLATLAQKTITARLSAKIPRFGDTNIPDTEARAFSRLMQQLALQRPKISVRQLLSSMPTLLPRIKPCLLMSPLSVAQYLDTKQSNFDVVIFDEASQIPVWDAVGAIARGKQLIVVGDPKQLPPTNFFQIIDSHDDVDDSENVEQDLEKNLEDMDSILDELMTMGVRHKRLLWHYRSQHENLITFSNYTYYENSLLTFPSADIINSGVRLKYLPEARYDRGKSCTNEKEARILVDELVKRLLHANGEPRSFGVVTFSVAQQKLIEDLLDQKRRDYPEIEIHFGDNTPVPNESVFVKNLENVQGDERDIIFFSVCYGPDEAGKISMHFGPLNRDGGKRRLNVAITRAKHEVLVFSSMRSDQIDHRARAKGVQDLKQFLDYAERGPQVLISANTVDADAEPDSEFERMVAERIRAKGYEVRYQVGCSGYKIDIGIVDPETPGKFLLGVECDGATYHSAATARDRDKLRQQHLENLGWKIHRIWSTAWWHDADGEMDKLLARLVEIKPPIH
jgi:very-short-patch-repair endonuclease